MTNPLEPVFSILWMWLLVFYYNFLGFLRNITPHQLLRKKDVSDDIVLITGGGMGIGRLMSLEFAKLGATVVIWDINKTGAENVVKEIKELGGNAYSYVVDICDSELVYKVADKVRADVGHVTILVNNAGIVTGKKFLESPDSLIRKTMDVNVNAHFWTLKAFLPHMLETNHGHIVTIASLAGMLGVSGLVDYCASKFAAVGLDDSLYHELVYNGKTGVHCTVVCPFYINTGMFEGIVAKRPRVLPILEPGFVVNRIILAVRTNQRTVILPDNLYFFPGMKGLFNPKAIQATYDYTGVQDMMLNFRGREKRD